jgi:hypothetical protein
MIDSRATVARAFRRATLTGGRLGRADSRAQRAFWWWLLKETAAVASYAQRKISKFLISISFAPSL